MEHGVEFKTKYQSDGTNYIVILVPNERAVYQRELKVKVVDKVFESKYDVLKYLDSNSIQARYGRDAIVVPIDNAEIYSLGNYKWFQTLYGGN